MNVRVHVFMRPDSAFCLISTDGVITSDSTMGQSYVGEKEMEAVGGAISVGRYWNESIKDNEYAQHTVVEREDRG